MGANSDVLPRVMWLREGTYLSVLTRRPSRGTRHRSYGSPCFKVTHINPVEERRGDALSRNLLTRSEFAATFSS